MQARLAPAVQSGKAVGDVKEFGIGLRSVSHVGWNGVGDGPVRETALKRQTTAVLVADELRRRIVSGQLREGQQIRQELIAGELGVSRIPVREALKQLEAEGFLVIHSHKGAVVSKLSIDEIAELFDLRAVLEAWVLGLAIPRMTAEDLDAADSILQRMIANDRIDQWGTLNWEFHMALYRPSGRMETLKLINRLHGMIDRYVRLQISLTTGQTRAHREHAQLLEFCRQRDPVRAARLLEDHIREVRDGLLKHLSDQAAAAG